jgi:hypothetical protein
MKEKQLAIERRDLAAYPATELKRMAHLVHTVGETLADAKTTLDVAILADLEGAVSDELVDICNVLNRVERRVGKRTWQSGIRMRTGTWATRMVSAVDSSQSRLCGRLQKEISQCLIIKSKTAAVPWPAKWWSWHQDKL